MRWFWLHLASKIRRPKYRAWSQRLGLVNEINRGGFVEGVLRIRFGQVTPNKRYGVFAMAQPLGSCARPAAIIRKGMIYAPQYGDIDFTVPMFDDFLRRTVIGAASARQEPTREGGQTP